MYIRLIVLEQSHDSKIWITFFTFFKWHFKKRKKSRFFGFSKKNVKNVFSNYGLKSKHLRGGLA